MTTRARHPRAHRMGSRPPKKVAPPEVHGLLGHHMLADGFDLVLDLEKSNGCLLYDSLRERQILDFFSCFSTCALGYNHPGLGGRDFEERILVAAKNKPSNSDFYTTQLAEFVSSLAETLPAALRGHLFFIDGGALAVENALKAAFDWKIRKNLLVGKGERGSQVIHFREAFHGRSGYTLSLTNTDPRKTLYFPKFSWPRITNPKLSFPLTDRVLEEVEVAEARAISEIKQALVDHRDDIAALIVEPIQGEGGDNHFRGEFLTELRDLALAGEFLLVFDEIQTGFATTGRWWCCEHFDVVPDILVFGKKSQVCGIAASPRLDEVESVFEVPSRINSTWGGNLVDMIRCQRFIEIIEDEALLENASRMGARLLEGCERLEGVFAGKVTNSRGRGLFVAFDLPDKGARDRTITALQEEDLLALGSGERSLRFRPPLILTGSEVDEGLRRVETSLRQVL